MIRKLAFALSILCLSFSSALFALGLGEAKVSSALNQPLEAEIEVLNVKGLTAEEILPGLATREEFLRAGVDRVFFLSDLRFKVEQKANGTYVVRLTTNKPVREPFLNFLVEVIWPSGRLLREYALLIDPPLFAEEAPKPVAPAVTNQVASGDVVSLPAPAPAPTKQSLLADRPSIGDSYGPTTSKDTLWDIALRARPDRSVSPQQVMLAIQDLNPGAFIDGNINKLKAGQVLRLPTKAQIQQRSLSDAINAVIVQNEALNPRKKKVLSAAKPQPKAPVPAPAKTEDQLKLVVANNASGENAEAASNNGVTGGSGSGTDEELTLAMERLDKASLENEELSVKVQDLESQLQTLQRLLTLKNDQLSQMQAQARETELKEAQAAQEQIDTAAETGQASGAANDDAAQAEGVTSEVVSEVSPEGDAGANVTPAADAADSTGDEAQTVAEVEASAPKPAPVAAPKAEKPAPKASSGSVFDLILNNTMYQVLVGVGLLVLFVILWLVSKSNERKEAEVYESGDDVTDDMFGATPVEEVESSPFDEGDSAEAYESEEPDLANAYEEDAPEHSEFDDAPAPEGETEDIIGEADVYIAYGRLDQAASILEQGIANDPIRTDYRLKLLEVYAETGEAEAFDRQFSELEAIQDQDAIDRALEIKGNMSASEPEDELADDLMSEAAQEDSLEDEVSESLDNNFDFESVESELEEDDLGVDLESDDLDLDLDIDLKSSDAADAESAVTEDADDIDAGIDYEKVELDADLEDDATEQVDEVLDDNLDAELDAALAEETDASTENLMEDASEELSEALLEESGAVEAAVEDELSDELADDLELELELSEDLETEAEIDLADDLSIPDELLELDGAEEELSEADPDATVIAPAKTAEPSEAVVSDDILEEAAETLAESPDSDSELEPDEDFDFLDGTDEASTKLDLARAYIDMGDVEGARDILLEVEKEGNEEQQADARSLIDSLGS